MRFRWVAALSLCAAGAVVTACGGDARYDVEVEVVGDVSSVTWVELAVIERCADLASPNDAPASPIRIVEFSGGGSETAIGYLPPGRYGLQGRAWAAGCVLLGSECEDVSLEAGGEGTLHLLLEPADGRGCDPGDTCVDDTCAPETSGT